MWSNPSHISSTSNLSILVIFIIWYCILPSLFIPQIDSYLSLIQRGQLSDGFCCGLNAVPVFSLSKVDLGHCRHRTWIASDGLLYHFSSFSFSGDLFPLNDSN
uniref:Uncharacterized protein n=1 Tax=Aotus nancymaae TaxID=37293 RepID=A0A2K5C2I2_AOTNA